MKNTVNFYSPKELERIKEVIETSTNLSESARVLAKEFGRSESALSVKLYTSRKTGLKSKDTKMSFKKEISVNKTKEPKTSIAKFKDRTITIPIKSIIIKDSNLIITH